MMGTTGELDQVAAKLLPEFHCAHSQWTRAGGQATNRTAAEQLTVMDQEAVLLQCAG